MSEKNTFIVDKFQKYVKDAMKDLNCLDIEPDKQKKSVMIPKITSKDQIYWICEHCGKSNPYFLSSCKDCNFERPSFLYDKYEPLCMSKKTIRKPISEVITDYWQSMKTIASKMGINTKNEIKALMDKLNYLEDVNYLKKKSGSTMYKKNDFKM